ncbi:MAG TPA: cytochrome c, partial [Sulfurovum sp.]|nr:cytochrome c [Sulfurovum sp.]
MMKKISLVLLFCSMLHAEDFISEFEYGQMLYQNPRGVSCVPC